MGSGQSSTTVPAANSALAALQRYLGMASLAVSLMASIFVGNAPICLAAGLGFWLLGLLDRSNGLEFFMGIMAAASAMLLLTTSLFGPEYLPEGEIFKAALGTFLFFSTLIFAPSAVIRASRLNPRFLNVLGLSILAAFLLDYLGVVSLKAAGVVRWFETETFKAQFDLRPSGLFSEPSWHALAAGALAYYLSKSLRKGARLVAVALTISGVISGSSIGLALVGPILLRLTMLGSRGIGAKIAVTASLMLSASILLALPTSLDLQEGQQVQKILNPTEFGSGTARFVQPISYLQEAFFTAPVTGMGLSFITERLIGRMGAAILPLNVFIESGMLGLIIYSAFFVFVCVRWKSNVVDLSGAALCMGSLGLQGSPFQAILLVLFLAPWGGPRSSWLTTKNASAGNDSADEDEDEVLSYIR